MLKNLLSKSTWRLVSYESQDAEGEIIYPLGKEAHGYIYFSDDGFMGVQMMAIDHENLLLEKVTMNTKAEEKIRKLGYHAYSGKYKINEESMILTTTIEVSLLSEYINTLQKRAITLDENSNILHLSNIDHPERKLIWKKAEHLKTP